MAIRIFVISSQFSFGISFFCSVICKLMLTPYIRYKLLALCYRYRYLFLVCIKIFGEMLQFCISITIPPFPVVQHYLVEFLGCVPEPFHCPLLIIATAFFQHFIDLFFCHVIRYFCIRNRPFYRVRRCPNSLHVLSSFPFSCWLLLQSWMLRSLRR